MRPTVRAVVLAALGLPVSLLPTLAEPRLWTLWPAFLGVLLLALGVDAALLPRRRDLSLDLELPDEMLVGEPGRGALLLRLASRRPVPVRVAVDLSDRFAPQPPLEGRVTAIGVELLLPLVPLRRGRGVVERAWVRWLGPLGLMAAVARIELKRAVMVTPNIRLVRATALRLASDREFNSGIKIERYAGDGSEFDSLREYARGDDQRSIDWKVSARHRKLVARQNRAERNHQVVLCVDSGYLMGEPLEGVPRLDHAVKAALLLAYVSLKAGDRVGLASFDARLGLFVEPVGGLNAFPVLHRMAGRIDYSDRETNFTLALTTIGQRLHRRSLVVVLTDFVDSIAAELMLENLGRLARRHVVLFVALRDPALAATAGAAPTTLLDLNRAVVAGGLVREREIVLRRLRRQGILPLDAAPGEVSPRLVNAYLDIKRRERI
jgi:uncharacterized protein (DUF58 family)